jgi:hypothetical protein
MRSAAPGRARRTLLLEHDRGHTGLGSDELTAAAPSPSFFSLKKLPRLTQEQAEVLAIVIADGIATRRRIEEIRGAAHQVIDEQDIDPGPAGQQSSQPAVGTGDGEVIEHSGGM